MKLPVRRLQVTVAAIAVCAAAGVAAMPGTVFASSAARTAPAPVLVNCANKVTVKPSGFVLTCADGNDYLTHLHWVSWQSGAAFGSGTEVVNDCIPNCAGGRFLSYPVLVTLWRPEARPHQAGQRYFSRLTEIHTGSVHKAKGSSLPQVETWQLWASAGWSPRPRPGR